MGEVAVVPFRGAARFCLAVISREGQLITASIEVRVGVVWRRSLSRTVLNNDDCSGLPPANPGSCRRLAGRWWIAQHRPRRGLPVLAEGEECQHAGDANNHVDDP